MSEQKVNLLYECNICYKRFRTNKEAESCHSSHNFICISCKKHFKKTECGADNATAIDIKCWYGSRFDGETFFGLICDDCLEEYIKLVEKEKVK